MRVPEREGEKERGMKTTSERERQARDFHFKSHCCIHNNNDYNKTTTNKHTNKTLWLFRNVPLVGKPNFLMLVPSAGLYSQGPLGLEGAGGGMGGTESLLTFSRVEE